LTKLRFFNHINGDDQANEQIVNVYEADAIAMIEAMTEPQLSQIVKDYIGC